MIDQKQSYHIMSGKALYLQVHPPPLSPLTPRIIDMQMKRATLADPTVIYLWLARFIPLWQTGSNFERNPNSSLYYVIRCKRIYMLVFDHA